MLHSCHGRLHLIASHASFASHNVGKLAKVRCNKSSGGSSNLCWGERSPFLKMGRVRLEGGNCRPPSGRSSTHLGCPRISHIPNNIPTTLSTNVSYPTIICRTIDQFCIRQPRDLTWLPWYLNRSFFNCSRTSRRARASEFLLFKKGVIGSSVHFHLDGYSESLFTEEVSDILKISCSFV